ncbi:MAG: hypothetical protein WD431_07685 [Cyclobacteriaceae bacterium]
MAIGRPRYELEFVNDSIFTIKLDANKYIGRYRSRPSGEFKIKSLNKAGNVCCDSELAQFFLNKVLKALRYKSNESTLWLLGVDEEVIFMERKINQ